MISLPGFPWASSSHQTLLWKGGSPGKEKCRLSFVPAGLQSVHWDRHSTSCSHGTWDELWRQHLLIQQHFTHPPVWKQGHGWVCSRAVWTEAQLQLVWMQKMLAMSGCGMGSGQGLQRTTQTCRSATFIAVQQPVQSVACPGATQHPGTYHAGHDI